MHQSNKNQLRFLDLFSGIGGFRLGLEQAGHRCVGYVENDKFARIAYQAIHDTKNEWTRKDITQITNEEWRSLHGKVDIITAGFPCQSFSVAGKRQGFSDVRGTLFFEIARAAKQIQPQFLLLENVKGLLSHEAGLSFATILSLLDELGYDVQWQVLNSKDFGVPQNRERVFIIGYSRAYGRQEIFPLQRKTGKLSPKSQTIQIVGTTKGVNQESHGQRDLVYDTHGLMGTVTATDYKQPKQIAVGGLYTNASAKFDSGIMPNISRTIKSGSHDSAVCIREATSKGYTEANVGDSINISYPNSRKSRGRVGKQIAQTVLTGSNQAVLLDGLTIRKLTPRECWRLQGFPDSAFEKAQKVCSDTQLYKQAGNAVTVPVIYAIAKKFKKAEKNK